MGVEGGEGSEMSTLENTANTTQWTAPARHLLCSVSDEMTMRIFFKAGGTAEQKRGERGRVCGVDVRLAGTPRFLSPLAMGRRTSERTDGRTDQRTYDDDGGGREASEGERDDWRAGCARVQGAGSM